MDYTLNRPHLTIVILSLFILTLFGYAIFNAASPSSSSSLTGYVVLEGKEEVVRVSTAKLDPLLVQEIQAGENNPKVIVLLEETAEIRSAPEEKKEEAIHQNQEGIIADLKEEVTVGRAEERGMNLEAKEAASPEPALEITHAYDTLNALSGNINDPQALAELTKNKKVKKILWDYPVELSLDTSVPQINASQLWSIPIDGKNIDGAGETVCIIDTGIDYTHPALGGCHPVVYQTAGTIIDLPEFVQSEHPYADNLDYTWKINFTGFDRIAVHFTNITLEALPSGGDSTDRIYVYDQNYALLAVYKETLTDVWTPTGEGDTLYVRLVSDGSVTGEGFYIDKVIDGTTNTTMAWDSCPTIIGGWDAYNNDADPRDDHGHGTHIAGIVASQNETYRGVAPGAKLVAIKAISANGNGYSSDVAAGIEWCNTNALRLNISIISMSLGGSSKHNAYCPQDLLATIINNSYQQNIAVFIAAGNNGWVDGISNPACIEQAFPVGGVDEADGILYNRGALLHLLAPAVSIQSTALAGSWNSLSGTSMATPHLAGAAALLREYWRRAYNQTPTPAQLEQKLRKSGKLINDAGSGLNFTRIDVFAALHPALEFTSPTPLSGSSSIHKNFLVNLTSDLPLSTALLQWTYPNQSVINFSMNAESSLTFIYPIENLSLGNHTYQVYAQERGGIWSVSPVRAITIEAVPFLNLTVFTPLENSYFNSEFALNISIAGEGLSFSSYILTNSSGSLLQSNQKENLSLEVFFWTDLINLSALAEGHYTLTILAKDDHEVNFTKTINFVVDKTLPEIFGLEIPETVFPGDLVVFKINVSDLNLNPSKIFLEANFSGNWDNYTMSWENGAQYNFTLNSNNFTVDKTFSYRFHAVDLARNQKITELLVLSVQENNSAAGLSTNSSLEINVTSPLNGSVLELGDLITFTAVSGVLGNTTYSWNFGDGTNAATLSATKAYSSTGNYLVLFQASNSTSSLNTTLNIFVNDTRQPTISSLKYLSEVHLSRDLVQQVNATLFDYSKLYSVNLFLNGTAKTLTAQINNTYHWKLGGLSLGNYSFRIEAVDNSSARNAQNFTYNFTVTSCDDGQQNGDETGVDCGGSCPACSNQTVESSTAEASSESSSPAAEASPEIPQVTEASLTTTADTASVEAPAQEAQPLNWTNPLSSEKNTQKEVALYILGILVIMLLAIYVFVLKKE